MNLSSDFTCGLCGEPACVGMKIRSGAVIRRCAECYSRDAARAYLSADGAVFDDTLTPPQFRRPTAEEVQRQDRMRAARRAQHEGERDGVREKVSKLRKVACSTPHWQDDPFEEDENRDGW